MIAENYVIFSKILCEELVDYLEAAEQIRRVRRDFRIKVLMVLWILATPDTFRSVALQFGVHPGELYRYYTMIIRALCALGEHYITWPNARERREIKHRLEAISGFPGWFLCYSYCPQIWKKALYS